MGDSERGTTGLGANVAHLQALGDLALRRHAECRARQPQRGAASLLRVVIAVAQRMAGHDELHAAALALLDRVIVVAQAEECALAQAGNSAAYLSVWLAAETARGRIASLLNEQQPAVYAAAQNPAPEAAGMVTGEFDEKRAEPPEIPARAARLMPTQAVRARYAPSKKPGKQRRRHAEKWR